MIYLLKDDIVKQLKEDKRTRKIIAEELGLSLITINRWIADNHINLTCYSILKLISKEYMLPLTTLITKVNFEDDDEG